MDRDFTNCRRTINTYGGQNGTKIGILYENQKYMMKLPPKSKNNKAMNYTNSCISEYVACHIIQTLNIPVQETLLGTYRDKIAVICKDFTNTHTRLQDFACLKNTIIDSEHNGYGTELSDILKSINEQQLLPPQDLKKRFWDMFIADALLGNFDRHNGNWGFLVDMETEITSLAPIYDCGSCLYPQLDEKGMEQTLSDEKEIEKRILLFPNSAIKEEDVKINYVRFLMSTKNKDCIISLQDIGQRIDIQKIKTIINETPYISDVHKKFLGTMIEKRNELIIKPALERTKQSNRRKTIYKNTNKSDSLDLNQKNETPVKPYGDNANGLTDEQHSKLEKITMKETKKQAERYNNTNQENSKITKYLKAESDPNEIIAKQNSKQENSYNFGD